jgi:hypothetical protein
VLSVVNSAAAGANARRPMPHQPPADASFNVLIASSIVKLFDVMSAYYREMRLVSDVIACCKRGGVGVILRIWSDLYGPLALLMA